MDSRARLQAVFSYAEGVAPPRYESEFSDEAVQAWREQGVLDEGIPETCLGLDYREDLGIDWRRVGADKAALESTEAVEGLRGAYKPDPAGRYPEDWQDRLSKWRERDYALHIMPWNEGFFQAIGISDGASSARVFTALCECPEFAEAAMDHYAGYLETMLDTVLAEVDVDHAVFREPVASNHGTVVSPKTYERFAVPALRRVVACLERHGITFRVMWTAGAVQGLVPLWLDAGVNGLFVNQSGQAGVSYRRLREQCGPDLRLFGGIDWRVVMDGPDALEPYLDREIRPVLEQGGYVPYLDDTVRGYMPYDTFRQYRDRLDALIDSVYS